MRTELRGEKCFHAVGIYGTNEPLVPPSTAHSVGLLIAFSPRPFHRRSPSESNFVYAVSHEFSLGPSWNPRADRLHKRTACSRVHVSLGGIRIPLEAARLPRNDTKGSRRIPLRPEVQFRAWAARQSLKKTLAAFLRNEFAFRACALAIPCPSPLHLPRFVVV